MFPVMITFRKSLSSVKRGFSLMREKFMLQVHELPLVCGTSFFYAHTF
jgi:hypothetical protein